MTAPPAAPDRKPRDEEIDVYGLTHPGKVRTDNQDHFLVCALRKQMVVQHTSLAEADHLLAGSERVALLMMVADGVGGGNKGEEASRSALEAVASTSPAACTATMPQVRPATRSSARRCRKGRSSPTRSWCGEARRTRVPGHGHHADPLPRRLAPAYLLQVGDSRCYLLRATS